MEALISSNQSSSHLILNSFIPLLDLLLQSMDVFLQGFDDVFKLLFFLLHCFNLFIFAVNLFVQAVELKKPRFSINTWEYEVVSKFSLDFGKHSPSKLDSLEKS